MPQNITSVDESNGAWMDSEERGKNEPAMFLTRPTLPVLGNDFVSRATSPRSKTDVVEDQIRGRPEKPYRRCLRAVALPWWLWAPSSRASQTRRGCLLGGETTNRESQPTEG